MSASYRFTFTRTRGVGSDHEKPELQLAEIDLYRADGASVLSQASATNPSGHLSNLHQQAQQVIDRQLETKWLDGAFQKNGYISVLDIMLPAPQIVAAYNLWTANDVVHRDPVSWKFQMRLANGDAKLAKLSVL